MARTKRVKEDKIFDVSGKSISDLMSLENVETMSGKNLARVVSRLASAGNKRIKRMEESGIFSPALIQAKENGGKFSVKGKNQGQLQGEYARIRDFLLSETATVKGAKHYNKVIQKKSGVNISNIPKNKQSSFWSAISRIREMDKTVDWYSQIKIANRVIAQNKKKNLTPEELEVALDKELQTQRKQDISEYEKAEQNRSTIRDSITI